MALPLRVALLGLGTVGLGVYQQLCMYPELFEITGVAVRHPRSISQELPHRLTSDPWELVEGRPDVLIEAIGGRQPAADLLRRALAQGSHVVTANKLVMAHDGPELLRIALRSSARLLYAATVGGSVPMLEFVEQLSRSRPLQSLVGVLNGTMNFVLDHLAAGVCLEDAVHAAQTCGFAEADPRMDLDGSDAECKLTILARLGFGVELLPSNIQRYTMEKFDPARVQRAAASGRILRQVGSLKRTSKGLAGRVALIGLAPGHPLARPRREENALIIHPMNGSPVFLSGKGAGRWPTGEAMMADLLMLARDPHRRRRTAGFAGALVPASELSRALVSQRIVPQNHSRDCGERPMKFETRLLHFDPCPGDPFRPVATPIYQTATFEQESASEFGRYDYSRSGNPTRTVLEEQLARLEHGQQAFCFSSGLAAITAVVRLLRSGDEIVAGSDLYGGTYRLFSRILDRSGIHVRYANGVDLDSFRAVCGPLTRLIHIETPTNPLLRIIHLESLADLAHCHGALLCVDNSLMSPYLQNPLDHGADLVVHSATKYLCGHSDVTAGAVIVRDPTLAREIYFLQNGEGAALSPFDSYLLLRGLKTLALRLDRQQASAERIARYLDQHPLVARVHYPGLESHPHHQFQARGPGAVLGFETGSAERSRRLAEATQLFGITVSFGGIQSSISLPACMSHASIPAEERAVRALPEDLVRISVGIEHADDLIADLAQALDRAAARRREHGQDAVRSAQSADLVSSGQTEIT
jgi:cystathionine beta-lyase